MELKTSVIIGDDEQVQTKLTQEIIHNELDEKASTLLPSQQLLKPVLTLMKFAGQYYNAAKKPYICNTAFVYCVLLAFGLSTEIVRMCFIYKPHDGFASKMFKALMHTYVIQSSLAIVIFAYRTSPQMVGFLKDYDSYRMEFDNTADDAKLKRGIRKTLLAGFLLLGLFRISMSVVSIFFPNTAYFYLLPLYKGSEEDVPYIAGVYFCFLRLFYSYNDSMGIVFAMVISHVLGKEFDAITTDLKKVTNIDENEDENLQGATMLRKRYLHMCKLVHQFDEAIGPYSLLVCVADLFTITIHVIPLMMSKPLLVNREITVVAMTFSGIDKCCHLGGLIYAGASLAAKARAILPVLVQADVENMSQKFFQVLQLLHMKASCDHIGLSAWSILPINKTLVVTIVSLGLTYTVIMARFGLTFGDTSPAAIQDIMTTTLPIYNVTY